MRALVQIIAVSVAAFASTNFDTLSLLVALHGEARRAAGRIAAGYLSATLLVALLAWAASSGLELLPLRWLDYLGVIPIALGVKRARELWLPKPAAGAQPPHASSALAVATLTLSQSVDNFAVLASLFADTRESLEPVIFASVVACALGLDALARWLAHSAPAARAIRRASRFLLPAALLAVGVHLLMDATTEEPEPVGSQRPFASARISAAISPYAPSKWWPPGSATARTWPGGTRGQSEASSRP